MFTSLSDRLDSAFKVLSGNNKLTELNITTAVKDVRRALVEADVNYKIAKEFTDKIKDRALGTENVLKNVNPGQLMIKIVNDELTELMGGQITGINLSGKPTVILIAGLQGSGKTTTAVKLAYWLKEVQKKSVMVTSTDIYRPAAITQLEILAKEAGVHYHPSDPSQKPKAGCPNPSLPLHAPLEGPPWSKA